MVHDRELRPGAVPVKDGPAGARGGGKAVPGLLALACLLLAGAGCEAGTIPPTDPRFGQVGEIRVEVRSPVTTEAGELQETLVWRSDGPWVLAERMTYEATIGSESVRRPTLNPGDLTAEYGSLIQQLNETPGLRLFGPEVPQGLDPECGEFRSRVEVVLWDRLRDDEARWARCMDGTFFTGTPGSAGPDAGASRVVTAAQLTRFFTLGEGAVSSYLGSLPFRSLDRGEVSPARPEGPRVFRSEDGTVPDGWEAFWAEHAGSEAPQPEVDWNSQMVLLGAVGRRQEAGDSVKVQRILPIAVGTRIELVEQVPGDFCSPAARESYPFHLVVAPRTQAPVLFNDPIVERIPCGI